MNAEEIKFIQEHLGDDLERLLLSANRYPDIGVPWCVDQIAARRQIRDKVPEWYACPELVMTGRVPAEQCSSELTARMKRRFLAGDSVCDLTGGMGIDLWYMSQGLKKAVYVERNTELFRNTRYNIETLLDKGETHTSVLPNGEFCPEFYFVNRDCRDFLADDSWEADTVYIDPARRASDGSRVYDLADCEPDVVELLPQIMKHCKILLIKVSPMFDLHRISELIPLRHVIAISAVRNECKEVLVQVFPQPGNSGPETVVCQDYRDGGIVEFVFSPQQESGLEVPGSPPGQYLYVPDVTLLKAGAFKSPCLRYGLSKLDSNTHLYTSDTLHGDFFGRIFRIVEALPFTARVARDISREAVRANVAVRNFPLTAEQLKKKLRVHDGGEEYIFGATVRDLGPMLLRCRKAVLLLFLLFAFLLPSEVMARREVMPPTVEQLCAAVTEPVPTRWQQGKPFVSTVSDLDVVLRPETALSDTARRDWKGSFWRFNAIVMEENWLGQPQVWLQFLSPSGERYRYETGRDETALTDTVWHPQIPGLLPLSLVSQTDSIFRRRELFIRVDDERIVPADSLSQEAPSRKFCKVHVDSVTFGTDEAPLRVWFSRDSLHFYFLSALPGSVTAPSIDRFFSTIDPRPDYPNISDRRWEMICSRQLEPDMTAEEVRLSWGKPYRYERTVTTAGPTEVWYYRNGARLLIINGRLQQ